MFDGAVAQPLQNWFLRRLALVHQADIYVTRLFILGSQTFRAAHVGLISEHNEEFGLLPVCCVFHHPRRDLLRGRKVERVVLNALTYRLRRSRSTCARGSDGSYGSCRGCDEEQ
jgi:hypothetical protein